MVVKRKQERSMYQGWRTPFALAGRTHIQNLSVKLMQHAVICRSLHEPTCLQLLAMFALQSAPARRVLQKACSLAPSHPETALLPA